MTSLSLLVDRTVQVLVIVYLFQDRHDLGEILLSLNYLPCAGRLNIDVIKAKQLLQTDLVDGSGKLKHRVDVY